MDGGSRGLSKYGRRGSKGRSGVGGFGNRNGTGLGNVYRLSLDGGGGVYSGHGRGGNSGVLLLGVLRRRKVRCVMVLDCGRLDGDVRDGIVTCHGGLGLLLRSEKGEHGPEGRGKRKGDQGGGCPLILYVLSVASS